MVDGRKDRGARKSLTEECVLTIYDLRYLGSAERLHRERAAWREQAVIEALDEDHFVLIVRPGRAGRLAA
jgi:hypothetical protein